MRVLRVFRPRIATAVLLAGTALAAVAVAGGASAAVPGRQAYLQANLCGNACNRGGLAVARNLARTVAAGRLYAVTLNEVCENQYARLRADLRAYRGQFDPTGPLCDNGSRYGNAILVRAAGVDPVGSWPLPDPAGDEPRRLMCLGTREPGTRALVVCVTHISYGDADIAPQIRTIAGILRGFGDSRAVLLGGDFNADAADLRLDPLYGTCYGSGAGVFEEADSAGCGSRAREQARRGTDVVNERTLDRYKLDDVFLSRGRWSSVRAAAVDAVSGLSDHRALWATATLRG